MPFTLQIFGAKQASFEFSSFAFRLRDWTTFLDNVEDFIADRVEQSFLTEGRTNEGGAWEPLSPRYAAHKAKVAPGAKILVLTGDMKSSILDEAHPQSFRRRRKDQLIFGSTNPLVSIHSEGHGFFLPARPILQLTSRDVESIQETANLYLDAIIRTTFTRRGFPQSQFRSRSTGRFV